MMPSSPTSQREAEPQPFVAAWLGKAAQLVACCGVQSARQPCMAVASNCLPPSSRCGELCLFSQVSGLCGGPGPGFRSMSRSPSPADMSVHFLLAAW